MYDFVFLVIADSLVVDFVGRWDRLRLVPTMLGMAILAG